ncbi:winged helix-turn-helix transcriptional regulator [Dyella jejuensis]|uniref:Winged helix-turn-helix transcriptional regulator n=1 Tax=Dyella jejuensis TaxID=1432009 RepID=A0ABW8JN29_9GAMM
MSSNVFSVIEKSIANLRRMHPELPVEWMTVARMVAQVHLRGRIMAGGMLKVWDITYPEYSILVALYGADGYMLPTTSLCEITGESSSNTKRLVHFLCDRKLVIRGYDKADRRKIMVGLSDAGMHLLRRALPTMAGLLDEQVRTFESGELPELVRLLKKSLKGIMGES